MFKNSPRTKTDVMLAFATFSDLGIIFELIKAVVATLRTLKIFVSKFDSPNEVLRLLLRRDRAIKFKWIEAHVLHPKSYTSDLTKLVRF